MVMGTIISHAARCGRWEPMGGSHIPCRCVTGDVRRAQDLARGGVFCRRAGRNGQKPVGMERLSGVAG